MGDLRRVPGVEPRVAAAPTLDRIADHPRVRARDATGGLEGVTERRQPTQMLPVVYYWIVADVRPDSYLAVRSRTLRRTAPPDGTSPPAAARMHRD